MTDPRPEPPHPPPPAPPLLVRSTVLDDVGAGDLLGLLEGAAPEVRFAWLRDEDGVVAGGEAARWPAEPGDDVETAQDWWRRTRARLVPDGPGPTPTAAAFGSFLFDPRHTEQRPSLVLPEWALVRQHGRTRLVEVSATPFPGPPSARVRQLLRRRAAPSVPTELVETSDGLDADAWAERVAWGVKQIVAGELEKMVLARSVTVRASRPVELGRVAAWLHAEYPRCWTFLVDGLVGASPEMLVRRDEGLVTSRVLAGTIGLQGETTAETLAGALASSSKDLAEHQYAVTSVAEALAPYCTAMNVPDAPYVLELPNVLHLATDVTAATCDDTSVLELVSALHPSAAVCGTPTPVARAAIAELEELDRGRYSGPVGWVDTDGDGSWAIALRCGQVDPTDPHAVRLFAGCGIVADSDPDTEVTESEAKLVPMRSALRHWAAGGDQRSQPPLTASRSDDAGRSPGRTHGPHGSR